MTTAAHAKYSASKMKILRKCPGCRHEIAKAPPERVSEHAERGTKIGDLADLIIEDWKKEGRSGKVFARTTIPELMHYFRFIGDLAGKNNPVATQVKCHGLQRYHPDIWGTADVEIVDLEKSITHIGDLKSGAGVMVEVVDEEGNLNSQLEVYILARLVERPTAFAQVHIVQPWGSESRGLSIVRSSPLLKTEELFAVNLPRLLADIKACDDAKEGEGLNPGPWCSDGFCPARMTCSALRTHVDVAANPFTPMPVSVGSYTPDELAALLVKAEAVETWAKEVRAFTLHEAQCGRVPTGFSLEQGLGNRKWGPEAQESAIIRVAGIGKKECMNSTLKTPTQLEKAVKDYKPGEGETFDAEAVWAKITEKFVVREPTSMKLKRIKGIAKAPEPVFTPVQPVRVITEDFLPENTIPTTATKTEDKPAPVFDLAAMMGGG